MKKATLRYEIRESKKLPKSENSENWVFTSKINAEKPKSKQ